VPPRNLILRAFLLLLVVLFSDVRAEAQRPRVYIVIVDALDAALVSAELTPNLWRLATGDTDRTTFYPRGRSAMPSVTDTNHVSVMTAAYAAAHGIVGNRFWDRPAETSPVHSEQARYLDVETLFTVIETEEPSLTTAALFGKSRLVDLFTESPRRQKRPDVLWGDAAIDTEKFDPASGFHSDDRTMSAALQTIADREPDLMLVALPDVDRTEHRFGRGTSEATRAVQTADREIGRLIEFVKSRGAWPRTVLLITADHGFRLLQPDLSAGPPYPFIFLERILQRAGFNDVETITNGNLELLALRGRAPRALDDQTGAVLKRIRALVLADPNITEAWYRLPNPLDGGDAFTVSRAHPEWRLAHPRAGELFVVANPNYKFVDPSTSLQLIGDHGGPEQSYVPIFVAGGEPRIRKQVLSSGGALPPAENPDLGATAAWLLGVRMPRMIGGAEIPQQLAGRVLREAFE